MTPIGSKPAHASSIARLEAAYGRLLDGLAVIAALLLLAMMLLICADVLLRNVVIAGLPRGVAAAGDLSESALYLITMLAAPWLLRQGQHIRVDVLLRVVPKRLAWLLEWISDLVALGCCMLIAWYGWVATAQSYASGSMTIKTMTLPEWWSLAPLPVAFGLLAVEVLFRMWRLKHSPCGPRDDAVSAS